MVYQYIIDIQEEFCFGEDTTSVESFRIVVVNVNRTGLACGATSVTVNLSFKNDGRAVCKYDIVHACCH